MLAALPDFINHWELESQLRSETVVVCISLDELIACCRALDAQPYCRTAKVELEDS